MCFCFLFRFWSYLLFFFFKQKTAYYMRISDWSSDVCSSDLINQFSSKYRMNAAGFGKFAYGCGLLFVELAGFLAPIGLVIGGLTVTGMVGTLTNDLVFIAGGDRKSVV